MKTFASPAAFAAFLATVVSRAIPMAEHRALDVAGEMVETEAKRVLGTHDYDWPPLKPATIAKKAKGDTPLLETGEMRDSIGHRVGDHDVQIGSDNDKAVWHELGTSRIPPRPFLAGALQHKADDVVKMIGHEISATLRTGFVPRGNSVPLVRPLSRKS